METNVTAPLTVVLDWRERETAHAERVADLTAGRRYRAARGLTHPIEDFLWDYYSLKPRHLTKWFPGVGAGIPNDGSLGWRSSSRWHALTGDGTVLTLDAAAFHRDRRADVDRIHALLSSTASRTPAFACFGWHEWAMVHRQAEHRHPLPLRLGQDGTDAVVEAAHIRCTHYDAFRFFTAAARPLNAHQPTRATQITLEQPACLHANMDLLRAALSLGPAVPGDLLLDTFDLAMRIRTLDMAASPYDCSSLGVAPVKVETAEGRAEYAAAQRAFAVEAAPLRARLLEVTTALRGEGA